MAEYHERIPFRLIRMPCCGQLVCWVNPRSPNFCPECGANVFLQVKAAVLYRDDEAMLTTHEHHLGMEYLNVREVD